jgi:hypothetical protein
MKTRCYVLSLEHEKAKEFAVRIDSGIKVDEWGTCKTIVASLVSKVSVGGSLIWSPPCVSSTRLNQPLDNHRLDCTPRNASCTNFLTSLRAGFVRRNSLNS